MQHLGWVVKAPLPLKPLSTSKPEAAGELVPDSCGFAVAGVEGPKVRQAGPSSGRQTENDNKRRPRFPLRRLRIEGRPLVPSSYRSGLQSRESMRTRSWRCAQDGDDGEWS